MSLLLGPGFNKKLFSREKMVLIYTIHQLTEKASWSNWFQIGIQVLKYFQNCRDKSKIEEDWTTDVGGVEMKFKIVR